ncbi:MAG: hypothetical protein MSD82_10505 [Prevotella sp.]|nr:hypothetical protein [Prevotella sp.]
MKKLMIAALMMLSSSMAFAGDSDVLKGILKAKTYAEAENLLKSGLAQLANSEEKAKAYNRLVDLAMEKVSKEQATMNANQMATQFKQGKVEPVDTAGLYVAAYNALKAGFECEQFDQQPNAKGKVAPKFHKANQARLSQARLHLVNAGQDAARANKNADVLKFWGMYVESASAPLFADMEKPAADPYIGQVASFATRYAIQEKDFEKANKYVDVALKDTAEYKDALNLKFYIAQQGLKTKEDSLKYLATVKEYYQKDPKNDVLFNTLSNLYSSFKQKDEMNKLIEEKLATDPNNYTAWALKGQNAINENKVDEAITALKKADPKNVVVLTYLGFALNAKAQSLNDKAQQTALYNESKDILEKARDLDPTRQQANWSYPLYQAYYSLYGAADSRTKEMEALNSNR